MIESTTPVAAVAQSIPQSLAVSGLLCETIDELGYQPFIAVGVDDDGWLHALLCPTQNEGSQFVDQLQALGVVERSAFLAGICASLMQDQTHAVDRFHAWLRGCDGELSVAIDLPTTASAGFANCVGYPLIRVADGAFAGAALDTASRTAAIAGMVAALASVPGNDLLRWAICEALALALARKADEEGSPGDALDAIAQALTCVPQSALLHAARGRLLAGATETGSVTDDISDFSFRPPRGAARIAVAPSPEELMYRRICELPHQPLFTLMISKSGREPQILASLGGTDVRVFVTNVRQSDAFAHSRFLRAYAAALDGEIYDAGAGWFEWIREGDEHHSVTVETIDPDRAPFRNANGYPLLYLCQSEGGGAADGGETRYRALAQILDAYETRPGNEIVRNPLLEGIGLALAKYLGHCERHAEALSFVQRVLRHAPRSIHVKAAENALERRLAGQPVPDRLIKFIGADNGALKSRICSLPFTRFDIGPSGDVLMCCGHWLPTSIGNFMAGTVDEVLNSPTAQRIRASMLDGSFKYCNHLECGAMVQDRLPYQDDAGGDPTLRAAIDDGKLTLEGVDEVLFAFDQTCNLSCPSCRSERIVEKPSENEAKAAAVERNLLPLLPKLKVLFINPAGELFASKPSRRLLELVNRETYPELRLDVISNGMLFSQREWEKFPNIHDMVGSVRISVDGCTKQTFETLRRLADFEIFCRNMEFLGGLRAREILPQLKFSFTYQLGNFREMHDFVAFARRFNCDYIIFERLQNLGTFTNEEFRARAVHLSDHPLHEEFLSVIRDPVFRHVCVWHDFEWEGTADHHGDDDRERWQRDSLKYNNSL